MARSLSFLIKMEVSVLALLGKTMGIKNRNSHPGEGILTLLVLKNITKHLNAELVISSLFHWKQYRMHSALSLYPKNFIKN